MRVLIIAPHYDRNVPGESWSTFKWVQGIADRCDTTVLTSQPAGWDASRSPTSASRIISFTDPQIPGLHGRLVWELKPYYPFFYHRARAWLRQAKTGGEHFDIVHQINPLALRFPSPVRGLGFKYVIGPLAGSLPTPNGFKSEIRERHWYRRLRCIDPWRLRWDPWLKDTYRKAELVLGVAPYVEQLLRPCRIKRFEVASETGVENVASSPKKSPGSDRALRFLFVGRVIRTKGVLDAIRALGMVAKDGVQFEFNIIGDGDLLSNCKAEAEKIGISRSVHFRGRLPRSAIEPWYEYSDIFLFPSFREPSGNVVFEAMSHGLPVIAARAGGPGFVINADSGILVEPNTPELFTRGLADAIKRFVVEPRLYFPFSQGALRRVSQLAYWPNKIDRIFTIFGEIAGESGT